MAPAGMELPQDPAINLHFNESKFVLFFLLAAHFRCQTVQSFLHLVTILYLIIWYLPLLHVCDSKVKSTLYSAFIEYNIIYWTKRSQLNKAQANGQTSSFW